MSSFHIFTQTGVCLVIMVDAPKERVQSGPNLEEGATYFTSGTGPPTLGRAHGLGGLPGVQVLVCYSHRDNYQNESTGFVFTFLCEK